MNVQELVTSEAMLNNYACMDDDDGLLSWHWSIKVKGWVTNEEMINNYDEWPSWKWNMKVRELAINEAMINNYASMDDGCSSWKWMSKTYASINDGLHENEIWRWKNYASTDDGLPLWNSSMKAKELLTTMNLWQIFMLPCMM